MTFNDAYNNAQGKIPLVPLNAQNRENSTSVIWREYWTNLTTNINEDRALKIVGLKHGVIVDGGPGEIYQVHFFRIIDNTNDEVLFLASTYTWGTLISYDSNQVEFRFKVKNLIISDPNHRIQLMHTAGPGTNPHFVLLYDWVPNKARDILLNRRYAENNEYHQVVEQRSQGNPFYQAGDMNKVG